MNSNSGINSMRTTTAQHASLNTVQAPESFRNLFVALLMIGFFSIMISVSGRVFGGKVMLGGNSVNTETHEIVIANAVLNVPENYIRHSDQRSPGVKAELDLYAVLPSFEGYSAKNKAFFNNEQKGPSQLLFITIEPQQMSRDMSGRFDPIYRQLIEPTPENTATEGLESYTFKKDRAIFANERLFVGARGKDRPFVARCISGVDGDQAIAPCERDVFLANDLSVKYRFPFWLLKNYRTLDAQVLGLIGKMIVKSPVQ
jgi:hypothetical protein